MVNKRFINLINMILLAFLFVLILGNINGGDLYYRAMVNELEKTHDGLYKVETAHTANYHLLVTNQSYKKKKVVLRAYVDNNLLFDREFHVKDQHEVANYYLNLEAGQHVLTVVSEDGAVLQVPFTMGDEKAYVMVQYTGKHETAKLSAIESDTEIGID